MVMAAFSVHQSDTSRVHADPTLCPGTRVGLTLRDRCGDMTLKVRDSGQERIQNLPMRRMGRCTYRVGLR